MTPVSSTARPDTWILLTAKLSPQPGGVADYSFWLADALARRGHTVHVVASAGVERELPLAPRVHVHRVAQGFGLAGLPHVQAVLRDIRRQSPHAVLLAQYVPHAFGRRGANLAFAAWLAAQPTLWVVFHEVAFSSERGKPLKERLLGVVQRRMARWIGRAAQRLFVTIPAWNEILHAAGVERAGTWLPVPSNLPVDVEVGAADEVRRNLGQPAHLVGHFGTFGDRIARHLEPGLGDLLRERPETHVLLLGRGSREFLHDYLQRHPDAATRVSATGGLPPEALSAHLSACDLLMQPYPDGVSCRRGTVMAGLSLGKPVVSNLGWLSESFWESDGLVHLATGPTDVGHAAAQLLMDVEARRRLGAAAKRAYEQRFSLHCLVRTLESAR